MSYSCGKTFFFVLSKTITHKFKAVWIWTCNRSQMGLFKWWFTETCVKRGGEKPERWEAKKNPAPSGLESNLQVTAVSMLMDLLSPLPGTRWQISLSDEARTNSHPSLWGQTGVGRGGTEGEKASPGKMFLCPPSLSMLGHGEIGLVHTHIEDENIGVHWCPWRALRLGTGVEGHALVGKAVFRRQSALLWRLFLGFLLPYYIILHCTVHSWGKGSWNGWCFCAVCWNYRS